MGAKATIGSVKQECSAWLKRIFCWRKGR